MNQKALLHRAPLFMLALLCFAALAQPRAADQNPNSYASVSDAEKNAASQYRQALHACGNKVAPAQCRRQAGLDYKQAKQSIKVSKEALDVQKKRDKQTQNSSKKSNNATTLKHGKAADGSALPRPPLAKQQTKSTPSPQNKATLSKKSAPQNAKQNSAPLAKQPTPDQRKSNVAKYAKQETNVAARKSSAAQKKDKRLAKDNARRAAGYTVDKP